MYYYGVDQSNGGRLLTAALSRIICSVSCSRCLHAIESRAIVHMLCFMAVYQSHATELSIPMHTA